MQFACLPMTNRECTARKYLVLFATLLTIARLFPYANNNILVFSLLLFRVFTQVLFPLIQTRDRKNRTSNRFWYPWDVSLKSAIMKFF